MSAWEQLIERYANGQNICNCRQAYYEPSDGKAGHLTCRNGCEANVYHVRGYIAERVLTDLAARDQAEKNRGQTTKTFEFRRPRVA